MLNKTSPHILSTAANLLGFCLFVITTLHATKIAYIGLIDEFTSIIALFLTVSGIFSFISIRTHSKERKYKYELIAEYIFIAALIGIMLIIVYMAFIFFPNELPTQ